jgi:biopolymer transport protein ExbD
MAVIRKRGVLKGLFDEEGWELPVSFIDVVFLLLLFFMITGRFRTPEGILQSEVRMGSKGLRPPPDPLILKVRASGTSPASAEYSIRGWATSSPTELAAQLGRMRSLRPFELAIQGEPGCPYRHVISALDACARAGVTDVGFTAPESG